ncbi:hypothetical protein ONQ97_26575, partial [Salmonella enterica subsp. enterica serovar Virginia]|nr:hypothetical protein [Salmonella enterica subsp. enterica serovar Virginia]
LWCSAGIGVLCGLGQFKNALAATIIILCANILLREAAQRINQQNGRTIASWRYDARAADDKLIGLISHWLFPLPVSQPVWHNGRA